MGKTIKDILNPDGSIDMNAAEAILSPEQQAQLKAQIIKEREGNQIALGKPLVQDMNEYLTTNENGQFLKERTELVGYDAGGNPVYKATSGAGNFINADDQIKLSGSKDALLVYDKNGICIGALNLDGSRNDTLTAIYKGGNLSTINDKPIPNNTGGNQIPTLVPPLPGLVPPENLAPNNTGHGDGLDNIEIQHDTGGNQIPEAIPALPGYQIPDNDWQNNALTADNRLPIPEKTTASNGLDVESNTKHTPGAPGFRPNAGVEPKNSLDLFEKSVPTGDPKVRLAIDNEGNIHRFSNSSKDGTGSYHWSGSTGDKNSLGHNELRKFNDIIKELRGK